MPDPNKSIPVSLRKTQAGKSKRRGRKTLKPKAGHKKKPSGYKPGKSLGPAKKAPKKPMGLREKYEKSKKILGRGK
tara:strand:- start:448 stop:675 length:228 start_codon:yes stop_codon:yes gene_type:complete